MNEKLSIIITHYNEPVDVIAKLFTSIREQRMVKASEIDVHIVEDGDTPVPYDLYKDLPFDVYHHSPGHQGVSAARNFGFDKSNGEYVMFCDCDDMFLNALALHLIMCAIEEKPDLISSAFIEENKSETGEMRIVRRDNDMTFIHGKAYRRAWMKREGVRFDPTLTIHEDGYFNRLAFILQKTKKYIETPFYLWCWRDDSICRKDEFVLKTYPELIRVRTALSKKLKEKGLEDEFKGSVGATFIFAYYDFMKPAFNNAEQYGEYIVEARKAVRKFWRKYKDVIRSIPKRDIANNMHITRTQAFKEGMLYETMTIFQFMKILEE